MNTSAAMRVTPDSAAYEAGKGDDRELAERLLATQSEFESVRANWDVLWESIAAVVFPRAQYFLSKNVAEGQLRGERVFDTTPGLALDRFAAAVGSYLTPDNTQWHGLKANAPQFEDDEEVKEYLEAVTHRLFSARYAPKTNFSSQAHECRLSLGAFGSTALYVDEAVGRGLRYRSCHMSEIYFGENFQGQIDRVHRKFKLKAYQIEQLSKERGWTIPEKVKRALEARGQHGAEFDILHCVYPNDKLDPRRFDHAGMRFLSSYVSVEDKVIVSKGGYRTMPYAIGRYVTGPGETYGRSPAMTVFRDILMLNEMNKDVIRAGQMHTSPPWILSGDGALSAFQLKTNALNYGYLSEDGTPLIQALRPEGELPITLEMIKDRREGINDAFLVTLFQILAEDANMTATEALLRAQEKGQLLGPNLGRQQSEFLGPMIEREIDILGSAGQLPPMPQQLLHAGAPVGIEFRAPLNRLQRTDEAVGLIRTIETIIPIAEAGHPEMLDVFDPLRTARLIGDANGAPPSCLRTVDEMEALQKQKQQQADLQNAIQAAPQLASAAKDAAQAQATAGNIPPTIPQIQPGP